MLAGALSDLRVIELSEMVAGPFCAKVMADLGAEVVKIEKPFAGDVARQRGPFPEDKPHREKSALYLYLNANKLGITLDVTKPEGTRLFGELVKDADVLVESQPPGFLDSLGIGYESLRALNPGLIMTSITPFGQNGPYRDYKGYDLNCYHMGVVGYETPFNQVTDPESQSPLKAAGEQSDFLSGWTAAATTMCAVFYRHLTGEGQHIDLARLEAVANMIRPNYPFYYCESPEGPNRQRLASRKEWGLPWVWPCRDGYVALLALTDQHWQQLKVMLGNPEWMESELFQTPLGRLMHADAVKTLLQEWLVEHDRDEIYKRGQELHLPVFPVQSVEEVMHTEHFRDREFFVEVDHPETGPLLYPGPPYKLSTTPWQIRSPAPRLGESNGEIYGQRLGLKAEQLEKLQKEGVI